MNAEFLDLPQMISAAGTVRLPGSKSISNRVLLLAALADGETEVRDLLAAAKGAFRALNAIGIVVRWIGSLAAAGVAIWGAVYAITHGGRPPGGH